MALAAPYLWQSPQKEVSLAIEVHCFKNRQTFFKDKFDEYGGYWILKNVGLFREGADGALQLSGWVY